MQNAVSSQDSYFIGVDIGTGSVGYAVTRLDYALCRFKGEPMWGVSLFDSAKSCADRRGYRSTRRRYDRRQMRVDLLQELFCREMEKVDPYFFRQLNESYLWKCDKSPETLRGCDWMNKEYKRRFPTVHHLIVELMESADGFDLRHLYLALAWLVAHRGHFLSDIDGDSIEELSDIGTLYADFERWFDDNGYERPWNCDVVRLKAILTKTCSVKAKVKELKVLFQISIKGDADDPFPLSREGMMKALAGEAVAVNKLITDSEYANAEEKICLKKPDDTEKLLPRLGDYAQLVYLMQKIFDCAAISEIKRLDGKDYQYISEKKVAQYEMHKSDLKDLKALIKKYCPSEYRNMFKDASKDGYSAYVSNFKSDINRKSRGKLKSVDRERFYKYVKQTIDKMPAEDEKVKEILKRIELGTYMPKQIDTDNRLIPHQLYYAELKRILENAEKVFPFLREKDADGLSVADKIKSIFNFRIPYYVGPLNQNSPFAWIVRKAEGRILPWNFDEKVDHEQSEIAFIARMTNKCTYLPGEDVLPRWSLLYSKFAVLNAISNITIDGRKIRPEDKRALFEEVFRKERNVTFKRIAAFFVSNGMIRKGEEEKIGGINKEEKLSYKPYVEFSRLISSGKLTKEDVEEIVVRLTCAQDSSRVEKWLEERYGGQFSAEDRKYIASRKFSEFGSLSKEFLNGIEGTNLRTGEVGTVMHFLWTTNDNLQQIIEDKEKYNFAEKIAALRQEYYGGNPMSLDERLDKMGISTAVKRPIIRTLEVVSDIVKIKKQPPKKIFVEMARGVDPKQDNDRKKSRKDWLSMIYNSMDGNEVKEMREQLNALGDDADRRLRKEMLFLYFTQLGKCMYCGEPIDIASLYTGGEYNIDHIFPQAYVKDDSILNNKVLVHSKENADKGDNLVLLKWRANMHSFWKKLNDSGLITDEKFRRLTRSTPFTDDEKQGFINRQLVETRQAAKAVTELFGEKYPDTEIVFVKAGTVSDFRNEYGEIWNDAFGLHLKDEEKNGMRLIKSRTASDVHHAHDAYLNIVVGNLFHEKFTRRFFNVSTTPYSLKLSTLFGTRLARDPSVWEPSRHLPIVDKVMATPYVRLVKYQTCQKGGFYDQTLYPAGDGELIPLKQGLDTDKYGGYKKPTASFFVLVRYKNGKKYELTLVAVELRVASRYLSDPDFALSYVKAKLSEKAEALSFPLGKRIIRIGAVLSLDGFEVSIAGKSSGGQKIGMRSLMPVYYPAEWTAYIKKIEKIPGQKDRNKNYRIDEEFDGISAKKNLEFFDYLTEKIKGNVYKKLPGGGVSVCDKRADFEGLAIEDQVECLKQLVLYLATNRSGGCDMTLLNGKENEGKVILSANLSNWKKKYSDVRLVDRSPSGLFERRSDNLLEML